MPYSDILLLGSNRETVCVCNQISVILLQLLCPVTCYHLKLSVHWCFHQMFVWKCAATFSEMHRSALISFTWHPSALIKSSDLKTCVCVDPHFTAPYCELLFLKLCPAAPAFKVISLLCVYWCMSVFSDDLLSRLKRLLSVTFMHTVISLQQRSEPETTCSYELHRTEELFKVKQN